MRIVLNQCIFLNWNPVQLNKKTYLLPISGELYFEYKPKLKRIRILERKCQGSVASVQKKARHIEGKCICRTNYYPKQCGEIRVWDWSIPIVCIPILFTYMYFCMNICEYTWMHNIYALLHNYILAYIYIYIYIYIYMM